MYIQEPDPWRGPFPVCISVPQMPARSIASATISFGLVSVPVNLFSSSESSASVSFNMLHAKCGSRLKQQYLCASEGTVVEKDEISQGLRVLQGAVRQVHARGDQGARREGDQLHRHRGVRAARRGGPDLPGQGLLPRRRQGRRARLSAAGRGAGGDRPRGPGPVFRARQAVPGAGPPNGRHAGHGAAPLRGRAQERGRGAPARGHPQGRRAGAGASSSSSRPPWRSSSRRTTTTWSASACSRPSSRRWKARTSPRSPGRGATDQDHRPDGRAEGESGQAWRPLPRRSPSGSPPRSRPTKRLRRSRERRRAARANRAA